MLFTCVRITSTMLQLTTILFFIAFSTLAVLHALAIKLSLYWRFWWLDIPMHFFGGVIVALGLYTLRDIKVFPNRFLRLLPIVVLVLLVAVLWEVFEVQVGIPNYPKASDYWFDTIKDICMGVFGGTLGYVIGNSLRNLE